jgi:hypothetical protein
VSWPGRAAVVAAALLASRAAAPVWSAHDASLWRQGDKATQLELADETVAFERRDDAAHHGPPKGRFSGEWALITHQMTALGLAQICLAHPEEQERLAPEVTRAAAKSFLR